MLQYQLGPNLSPLSIEDMLDQYPKLSPTKLAQLFQTFIREKKHIPEDSPPYVSAFFSPWGQNIVAMISCVLGYSRSEYIDEIILAFMSIYTLGQPPATIYDFSSFIAGRMHEQFTRMGMRGCSNTPLYYTIYFYIIN